MLGIRKIINKELEFVYQSDLLIVGTFIVMYKNALNLNI